MAARYRWIITKDHIDDGAAVGVVGPWGCTAIKIDGEWL